MPVVERPEPPYLQVVRHIREQIMAGELTEGELVPSARKLATEWGVALATAVKALNTLRAEGLVAGVPGVGTVVTSRERHTSPQDRMLVTHRTGLIYPPGQHARVRSAELVPAPPYVADALGIESGALVIRRTRTTYNSKNQPESTSTSWFNGDLRETCPDLLELKRIKNGTAGYINARTGRRLVHGRDGIAAAAATGEVAAELGIKPGEPVLLGRNWWRDEQGVVAEFGESVAPKERWVFYDYEIGNGK
ncbi:GntR family transcriptional regulator [Lentzea sp. PSKA42]|uniref:GntR family transcriptional regulator n=1 Tax=Lentzea indica TaxID=2604800 RepID=A0ABX1FCX8_9PSEU|nr:GntR family transcriptional regulator [Lentzea indica]NKE56576.1 GntR family transcriptional regulator [Lentzea indica]